MARLNPYLNFDNNCREAMNFYKECLGGELTLQTIGESPLCDKMPPQMKETGRMGRGETCRIPRRCFSAPTNSSRGFDRSI